MAWVIRKAGVTKTFTTNWTTTWLTSYTTSWTTSWNSTYTTYTYSNTTTYWTSVVQQYAGEGPVIVGYNSRNSTYTTSWSSFVNNAEQCAVAGSCFQSYDSQLGGWYADNCPPGQPVAPCVTNVNSAPNLLGNGVVFYITYYSPQTVAINTTKSQNTNATVYDPIYAPGPIYNYDYYSTSGSTSTIIASNNTTATFSQSTSRNTSSNTSQNTSRITS